jgi:outer membrane protein assembly factor BamB
LSAAKPTASGPVRGLVKLVAHGDGAVALTDDGKVVALTGKSAASKRAASKGGASKGGASKGGASKGDAGGREPKGARPSHAARLGDAWLVATPGTRALALVPDSGKQKPFAKGDDDVLAFAVAGALPGSGARAGDDVAVAREGARELWSHAGKLRWRVRSDAAIAVTLAGERVLVLEEGGALVFVSQATGKAEGSLRLASPEPTQSWRLAAVGGDKAVLALGEWLVWVDGATRKTVRRVRAREKVTALDTDGTWLVVGCEDGGVQAFDAATGEVLATFDAHKGPVVTVAVAAARIFAGDARGAVASWGRADVAHAPHVAAPVTALAAQGDIVAAADKEGHVHLTLGGRPATSIVVGLHAIAVGVDEGGSVWAATPRAFVRASHPWTSPSPFPTRSPATAAAADGAYVFVGNAEGCVDVFDRDRGAYVTSYALSDTTVTALARLPGKLLVVGTGGLDGLVYVVDVTVPEVVHRVDPPDEGFGITALAADGRGRIVASGSEAGVVALLDPARGRMLARIDLGETPVSLAFDPTGRRLACALADGTAAVVTLGPKGASVARSNLRGVTCVAWGKEPLAGFADGHVMALSTSSEELRPARG